MTTKKLIKAHVEARGPVSIDELASDIGEPKLDVLPIVRLLTEEGELDRDGDRVRIEDGEDR